MNPKQGYGDQSTMLNNRLTKIIGVHQMLDPNGPKIFSYNIFLIIVTFFITIELILLFFNLVGVIYWINDRSQASFQITIFINFSFSCYFMIILIRNTAKIRCCINVACDDFLKFEHYKHIFFTEFQLKSILISNIFALTRTILLLLMSVIPTIFYKNYINLEALNGTLQSYRLSAFNIFFPVTSDTYNRYFILFHLFEFLFGLIYVIFTLSFDSIFISICYAICCHLKTTNKALETLGGKYRAILSKY